jgi:hypothetical protein
MDENKYQLFRLFAQQWISHILLYITKPIVSPPPRMNGMAIVQESEGWSLLDLLHILS